MDMPNDLTIKFLDNGVPCRIGPRGFERLDMALLRVCWKEIVRMVNHKEPEEKIHAYIKSEYEKMYGNK